jgi:hypothetical protein
VEVTGVVERHEVRGGATVPVDQKIAGDAVQKWIEPAAGDAPAPDVNEGPNGGLLRQVCRFLGRASPGSEQPAETLERLPVGIVQLDGQLWF